MQSFHCLIQQNHTFERPYIMCRSKYRLDYIWSKDLLFYLVTQMSLSWHFTLTLLLWVILGMKCTTKVKSLISILYHLQVLIYICTFWGACTWPIYRCIVLKTVDPTNYGYELKNGSLVPLYHQNNVAESLVQKCSCLFCCCFMSQVNSYGHSETVSSPNHTFSWAGLNKRLTSNLCTYFCL